MNSLAFWLLVGLARGGKGWEWEWGVESEIRHVCSWLISCWVSEGWLHSSLFLRLLLLGSVDLVNTLWILSKVEKKFSKFPCHDYPRGFFNFSWTLPLFLKRVLLINCPQWHRVRVTFCFLEDACVVCVGVYVHVCAFSILLDAHQSN